MSSASTSSASSAAASTEPLQHMLFPCGYYYDMDAGTSCSATPVTHLVFCSECHKPENLFYLMLEITYGQGYGVDKSVERKASDGPALSPRVRELLPMFERAGVSMDRRLASIHDKLVQARTRERLSSTEVLQANCAVFGAMVRAVSEFAKEVGPQIEKACPGLKAGMRQALEFAGTLYAAKLRPASTPSFSVSQGRNGKGIMMRPYYCYAPLDHRVACLFLTFFFSADNANRSLHEQVYYRVVCNQLARAACLAEAKFGLDPEKCKSAKDKGKRKGKGEQHIFHKFTSNGTLSVNDTGASQTTVQKLLDQFWAEFTKFSAKGAGLRREVVSYRAQPTAATKQALITALDDFMSAFIYPKPSASETKESFEPSLAVPSSTTRAKYAYVYARALKSALSAPKPNKAKLDALLADEDELASFTMLQPSCMVWLPCVDGVIEFPIKLTSDSSPSTIDLFGFLDKFANSHATDFADTPEGSRSAVFARSFVEHTQKAKAAEVQARLTRASEEVMSAEVLDEIYKQANEEAKARCDKIRAARAASGQRLVPLLESEEYKRSLSLEEIEGIANLLKQARIRREAQAQLDAVTWTNIRRRLDDDFPPLVVSHMRDDVNAAKAALKELKSEIKQLKSSAIEKQDKKAIAEKEARLARDQVSLENLMDDYKEYWADVSSAYVTRSKSKNENEVAKFCSQMLFGYGHNILHVHCPLSSDTKEKTFNITVSAPALKPPPSAKSKPTSRARQQSDAANVRFQIPLRVFSDDLKHGRLQRMLRFIEVAMAFMSESCRARDLKLSCTE